MALLSKYTQIHHDIDETREETSRVRNKIDETHRKIKSLRQERETLEDGIESEKKKEKQISEETEVVLAQVETLRQKEVQLSSDIVSSKQKLEMTKQSINDYREAFIQESKEFRSSCKRLCTRVGILQMSSQTPLQSYAIVKQQQKQQQQQKQSDDDDGNVQRQYQEIISAVTRSNNKIMEEKDKNDETLVEAIRKKEDAETLFLNADKVRNELQVKKNVLEEKILKRNTRKCQLQSQLHRLQNEVNEIQVNIAKLEEDTLHSREMGANFKKGT